MIQIQSLLKLKIILIVGLLLPLLGFGNNLSITGVERLSSGDKNLIKFSISWENSWYVTGSPANHDAVWLFIKFRECGSAGKWCHAFLDTAHSAVGQRQASGHIISPDNSLVFATNIDTCDRNGRNWTTNHNTGVMIRRATVGIGDISSTLCTLKITGSTIDSTFDSAKDFDIRVFGVEMVQIPEGAFWAGDGSVNYNRYTDPASSPDPIKIANENTINIKNTSDAAINIQDSVPKGYAEFYCMKYEVSQKQYVDFLNTLTSAQAPNRYLANINLHGIKLSLTGTVYETDYPNRPYGHGSGYDFFSYLDWACLRPMTDLEFEKACRGPGYPPVNEYIWGSVPGDGDVIECTDVNYPAEGKMTSDTEDANVNYIATVITDYPGPGTYGVLDCGIFARDTNETRVTSGATYYGILDMAGNVHEGTVNAYICREKYAGIWGDGDIDNAGLFTVANWLNLVGVADAITQKGGYASTAATDINKMEISHRENDTYEITDTRTYYLYQIRGVR